MILLLDISPHHRFDSIAQIFLGKSPISHPFRLRMRALEFPPLDEHSKRKIGGTQPHMKHCLSFYSLLKSLRGFFYRRMILRRPHGDQKTVGCHAPQFRLRRLFLPWGLRQQQPSRGNRRVYRTQKLILTKRDTDMLPALSTQPWEPQGNARRRLHENPRGYGPALPLHFDND
nr:hypothetical protein Iba_chr05cCG14450 [Ipomoea batatas]